MLRLAIVGFGGYGWQLVTTINEMADRLDSRLVAAADMAMPLFPDKVRQLQDQGVELYDEALVMFEQMKGRCEAVYIATSIPSHRPLAIAAAKAGYQVHLEKPPTATVQETDAILKALDETGQFCSVGFQAVHGSDLQFIKQRLTAGKLGRVLSATMHAGWPRKQSYYTRNNWAGKFKLGDAWVLDGPATNALSHQINNLLYLLGEGPNGFAVPACVRSELYAAGPVESHNIAAIEITTDSGVNAYFLGTHCSQELFGATIILRCEKGQIVWTMYGETVVTYEDGTTETTRDIRDDWPNMQTNFIQAVRDGSGKNLRCPLIETRKMVAVLNAAHESSRVVHRVPEELIQVLPEGEGDSRVVLPGIDGLIRSAAEDRCLFSDLSDAPPWAKKTRPFDLAGYKKFPQQFRCE